MSNEQMTPETKGITVKLLATVDLGPEIEGMAGRQLRMRMVTFRAWRRLQPEFTTIKTDQASSTYYKERSLIIEMESLRTMGGSGWPEDRNPHTG